MKRLAEGAEEPPSGVAAPRVQRVSAAELHGALDHFKAELRAGGLRESTIHSYLTGSRLFVRWLAGDYVPGPPRPGRPAAERRL